MRTWRLGPFNLPEPKHLGPVLVAWGFSIMIMVSQNDLGSSLMFFTLFVVMLWVATSRTSYLVVGGAAVRRRRRTCRGASSPTSRSGSRSG